jgi:hypothetical protein
MKQMLNAVLGAFAFLPQGMVRRVWWLLPLMLVSALLEMVGLGLILPLVKAISSPGEAFSHPILSRIGLPTDMIGDDVVLPLAVLVAVFYLIKNLVLLLSAWVENKTIMEAVARGASWLMQTYMSAPYVFHLQHNSAELIRNINLACDDVFRGVLKPFLRLIAEGFIVAAIFTVLIVSDSVVTVVISLCTGHFCATVSSSAIWASVRSPLTCNRVARR